MVNTWWRWDSTDVPNCKAVTSLSYLQHCNPQPGLNSPQGTLTMRGDILGCHTEWGKRTPTSSEQSPGTLINLPQCTGQLPTAKNYLAQMSTMPKLENLLPQITAGKKKKKVPLNWGRCAHLSGSPRLLSATIAFKTSTFAKGKKKKKKVKN